MIKRYLDGLDNVTYRATSNEESDEFNSIVEAIDFILNNTRTNLNKHKAISMDDYGVYDISDILQDYGFSKVKLGMKINKIMNIYVLIYNKKLTTGLMSRFYKEPYFEAGKIEIIK